MMKSCALAALAASIISVSDTSLLGKPYAIFSDTVIANSTGS
jgi:hypothetical protein